MSSEASRVIMHQTPCWLVGKGGDFSYSFFTSFYFMRKIKKKKKECKVDVKCAERKNQSFSCKYKNKGN